MKKLILLLCVLWAHNAMAQPGCGFDETHRSLMAKDSNYAKSVQKLNAQWIQSMTSNPNALRTFGPNGQVMYEIPVVVHVMHTGGSVGSMYNPTDASINAMITYLNETYAAKYSSYPDTNNGGIYFPVRFVLAKRNPSCGSTSGINRVDASVISGYTTGGVNNGVTGVSEVTLKALSKWPNDEYYNIWIVNRIDGADGTSGTFTAGYAYFPGAPSDRDGTIMLATQVNANSGTLPHEIGHAFGLYHTFEGDGTGSTCPTNTNCNTDGDLICDTDPHKRSPFNCPSGTNPCTSTAYGTLTHNLMDYSNCKDRFTPGQRTRWMNTLLASRPGLAASLGSVAPPSSGMTSANCVTTIAAANASNNFDMGPIRVTLNDMTSNSGGYSNEGPGYQAYVDKSCFYMANLVGGTQYSVTVRTYLNAQKVNVFIDYNNDGIFGSGELVYAHTGSINGVEDHIGNFTVSSGATTCTRLRMRVVSDFASATLPSNGCGTLQYGQAEDFSVYIRPASSILTVANALTTGSNPSCTGSSLTFTATPSATPTSPTYTWYVNHVAVSSGSTNTYTTSTIANNSVVYCKLKYTGSCTDDSVFTNMIVVQRVSSIAPTISISANPGNSICSGTSVTFTAATTNGGTSPSYQWRVNGTAVGTNSNTYTNPGLTNGQQVACTLTSNATCATPTTANSNIITMAVTTSVTPSVTISANTGTTICASTSVTFTATPSNGGTTPSYQWRLNGSPVGSNSPTYTTSGLTNGQQVTCTLTSNATCRTSNTANSNTLTMTVNPNLTPSVSIAANPGNSVCAGTSVTFTATPVNGGTSPSYQWRVNGNPVGTNSNTYTTSGLTNGQQVTCTLTTNVACPTAATANSNAITMTVTPTVTPSVSISANPGNTICSGTSVIFTASPTNGGTTPTYQWRVNGNAVGTNSNTYTSTALTNGQQVTCDMTSTATCPSPAMVSSNSITMSVGASITPVITISANPGTTNCAGQAITFSATITGGGTSPSYQWRINGNPVGTNSSTYNSSSITNGQQVTCTLTSNLTCASTATVGSNTLNMAVVSNLAPSVSIAASPGNSVCTGTSVTFTPTPTNAGASPTYQWRVNGNPVTTGPTFTTSTLTNGQQVSCVATSSASCASPLTATSNTITMAIASPTIPSVTIGANPGNTICAGTSVTFTASPVNGGTAPTYQWKVNGNNAGTNSNTYTTTGLTNGQQVTCVMVSNGTCVSTTPVTSGGITMTVNPVLTPSVSIATNTGTTICNGTSVTFTATPTNGGSSPSYQWRLNGNPVGTNSTTYVNSSLTNGNQVTCTLTSNALCASTTTANSNAVTMLVNPTVNPTISIASDIGNTSCAGGQVKFTASITNGGTAPFYQWKINGTDVGTNSNTFTASASTSTVTCVLTSNAPCPIPGTLTSNAISITVSSPTVNISALPGNTICAGTYVNFSVQGLNTGNNPQYIWVKNGLDITGLYGQTVTIPALNNGDVISCRFLSSDNCKNGPTVPSTTIAMNVSPTTIPLVTISSNASLGSAEGDNITFKALSNAASNAVSYEWTVNNNIVSGANTDTYNTSSLKNGDSVTAKLIAIDSCIKPGIVISNTVIMELTLGVKDIEERFTDIRLIPNPNNGNFTLRGEVLPGTDVKDAYYEVLNALGAVIYKQPLPMLNNKFEERVQLNNAIANGLYMVRINVAGHTQALRFVSQK